MRHIPEGTDHLLFLWVLLLPAPLCASRTRWNAPINARRSLQRILQIVTVFAIGHSLTLGLAAFGLVQVPEQPVEVLIALSILISAVHALRPVFPGWERAIAAAFGLVHGLAFAAVLGRLGYQHGQQLAGLLAFNLGIEAIQLLVVAGVLPSLLLLSRTRVYAVLRIGSATVAGIAAFAWLMERLAGRVTPVDLILNYLARLAPEMALGLFLVSLCSRLWLVPRSGPAAHIAIHPLADRSTRRTHDRRYAE